MVVIEVLILLVKHNKFNKSASLNTFFEYFFIHLATTNAIVSVSLVICGSDNADNKLSLL